MISGASALESQNRKPDPGFIFWNLGREPQDPIVKKIEPAERAIELAITKTSLAIDLPFFCLLLLFLLSAAPRALIIFRLRFLGFRCAPPQGGVPSRASRLGCETLCRHPLRGLLAL